jgi:PHP family Zn ribbon phosphoesterase
LTITGKYLQSSINKCTIQYHTRKNSKWRCNKYK